MLLRNSSNNQMHTDTQEFTSTLAGKTARHLLKRCSALMFLSFCKRLLRLVALLECVFVCFGCETIANLLTNTIFELRLLSVAVATTTTKKRPLAHKVIIDETSKIPRTLMTARRRQQWRQRR